MKEYLWNEMYNGVTDKSCYSKSHHHLKDLGVYVCFQTREKNDTSHGTETDEKHGQYPVTPYCHWRNNVFT